MSASAMISPTFQDPPAVMVPPLYYGNDPNVDAFGNRRLFKKHKILPRPDRDRVLAASSFAYDAWPEDSRRNSRLIGAERPSNGIDIGNDYENENGNDNYNGNNGSPPQISSSHALRHQARPIQQGPELPPTPPGPSRKSSSSPSALPPTSTWVPSPTDTDRSVSGRSPVTPPNQQSPPTPDVTPPHRVAQPRAVRALLSDRTPPKSTSDSRSESFKTAREEPYTSEDETERHLAYSALPSARTSQSTVRHVGKDVGTQTSDHEPNGQKRAREPTNLDATPPSKIRPVTFDGEWRMNTGDTEVVQEWDDNLQRHVRVRKSRPYPDPKKPSPREESEAGLLDVTLVTPTNATKTVRAMRLYVQSEKPSSSSSVPGSGRKEKVTSSPPTSPSTTDARRFSGLSVNSVSTVVEAVVVDPVVPQRRRTLRHVKKQTALRDSNSDFSPGSSARASTSTVQETSPRSNPPRRPTDGRYNGRASAASFHSIPNAKARKEMWNQGAIPVVVIPDRNSSRKPIEPILRSTSSRRSRRSASLTSAPLSNVSTSREPASPSDRLSRHDIGPSDAHGADVRTIDYPPAVPQRTSSLSAPTSRNVSRAGSLTAESLKAHTALMEAETLKRALSKIERAGNNPEVGGGDEERHEEREGLTLQLPEVIVQLAAPSEDEIIAHRLSMDRHGDPLFGRRLSSLDTPFSMASMDTCGTAHEVAEALAINIYAHQNTSVVMVDHGSSKPSQASEKGMSKESQAEGAYTHTEQPQPTITTTAPDSDEPSTPAQRQYPGDDADYSPLRNPRSPPEPPAEPPAIKFIPATPSGATPAHERQNLMGNYFDEIESKHKRSLSLVRRALSRRRYSESASSPSRPTFLRTLSLSRGVRKVTEPFSREPSREKGEPGAPYPTADDAPADEHMLHPFWQPAYSDQDSDSESSSSTEDEDFDYDGQYERVYRYPPVDNRPRRNLSQRLKRTFAVLPLGDDRNPQVYHTGAPSTERRTIQRTASGNLRVVRRRSSLEEGNDDHVYSVRPYTAPEHPGRAPSFWRGYRRGGDQGGVAPKEEGKRGFLPTLGSKIGDIPRRLSERKRQKRTMELRRKISGPKEVRDGVGDVIRRASYRG
ncbi:uncharacterized protein DNG_00783 [Cephalotrichum gorgonifer]|uniref:Uncharacterized protein n=1 Tax=Cephalotrichum gorgonifer TaxID=2041049 RepID=A0AAE8SR73_9PEZI|nr:uncharacterized protein DNG_00783 [Cephalotrichum gorgonifer]